MIYKFVPQTIINKIMKIKILKHSLFDFYFGKIDLYQLFEKCLQVQEIHIKEYVNLVRRMKILIERKFPDLENKSFHDYSESINPHVDMVLPIGFFNIKRKLKEGLTIKKVSQ
jgi:hypothetical protein